MRKALVPMIASLALCGAATAALVATNARAQTDMAAKDAASKHPVMLAALVAPGGAAPTMAAPRAEGGTPAGPMRDGAMAGMRREQFCKDMYARRVGELAYFEAKLSLSGTQQPLFDRWKQATLDVAKRRSAECGQHEKVRTAHMPSLIDGMARREDRLKRRLADLESERPPLEALYNSLNQTQKMELTRGIGRLMMMRGMMEHRFAQGPHMMGHRMMMGMMGGPRNPEMGPPMGPPPPAQ